MRSSTVISLFGLANVAAAATVFPRQDAVPGSAESIANLKDKIKNVVHLLLENRSFDNIVGGQTSTPVDSPARNGEYCMPVNTTDPKSEIVCSSPRDFDSLLNDPDHTLTGNNFENYAQWQPDTAAIDSGKLVATNKGFVQEHIRLYKLNSTYAAKEVMGYYTPDQVPVITSFCENFVTFDKWHSCVPGVSISFLTLNPPILTRLLAHQPKQNVHAQWNICRTW